MRAMTRSGRCRNLTRIAALWAAIGLSAGCTSPSPHSPGATGQREPAWAPEATTERTTSIPVIRSGRYTLVELGADAGQHDLLQQVVDITMPGAVSATIGDALRYLLLRSGYRLCEDASAGPPYALPLPAVDLRLGPMTLREALQTLAGPAWQLQSDDSTRTICFARADAAGVTPSSTAPASVPSAASAPAIPAPVVQAAPLSTKEAQP
ncbi:PFGI-1 class ICE element type IV pilus protein PilL2 [Paraburkholderia ginsengisoli]|nr:PilL N-terminal domain-containing protein [Paraburkholderia ginsengisoli]